MILPWRKGRLRSFLKYLSIWIFCGFLCSALAAPMGWLWQWLQPAADSPLWAPAPQLLLSAEPLLLPQRGIACKSPSHGQELFCRSTTKCATQQLQQKSDGGLKPTPEWGLSKTCQPSLREVYLLRYSKPWNAGWTTSTQKMHKTPHVCSLFMMWTGSGILASLHWLFSIPRIQICSGAKFHLWTFSPSMWAVSSLCFNHTLNNYTPFPSHISWSGHRILQE